MQEGRLKKAVAYIREKAKSGYTGQIRINMNDGGITGVKDHKSVDLDDIVARLGAEEEDSGKSV